MMFLDRIKSFLGIGKKEPKGRVDGLAVIKDGAEIGPDVQILGGCHISSTASILDQAVVKSSCIEGADIFGSAWVTASNCGDAYAWGVCCIYDRANVKNSTIESGLIYDDAELVLALVVNSAVRGHARVHMGNITACVIEGDVHTEGTNLQDVWWWSNVP